MFFTFCGIDCSGKSTQGLLLAKWFSDNKIPNLFTAEPTAQYRSKILDIKIKMTPREELFLFLLDRVKHCEEVIIPHNEKGYWVVCDRYEDSTMAYQGYGRGLIDDPYFKSAVKYASLVKPELTFILEVPYEVSFERKNKRPLDRMETEGHAFYDKVINGYRLLAKEDEKRYCIIYATRPKEEVHQEIVQVVKERSNSYKIWVASQKNGT